MACDTGTRPVWSAGGAVRRVGDGPQEGPFVEGGRVATGGKSPSGKDRAAREERERSRLYQARVQFHDGQVRRRTRDNVIAGVVAGVLIVAVLGGQFAYYTFGPGAPAPEPTPTPTAPATPAPTPSDPAMPPTAPASPSPTPSS